MTSYTHSPLFGPSSKTDEINNITYYDYDWLGRLVHTKDINRNIITKNEMGCGVADEYDDGNEEGDDGGGGSND